MHLILPFHNPFPSHSLTPSLSIFSLSFKTILSSFLVLSCQTGPITMATFISKVICTFLHLPTLPSSTQSIPSLQLVIWAFSTWSLFLNMTSGGLVSSSSSNTLSMAVQSVSRMRLTLIPLFPHLHPFSPLLCFPSNNSQLILSPTFLPPMAMILLWS